MNLINLFVYWYKRELQLIGYVICIAAGVLLYKYSQTAALLITVLAFASAFFFPCWTKYKDDSDSEIIKQMDKVRDICATAHSLRSKNNIRLRQPLRKFYLIDMEGALSFLENSPELVFHIKDECNVENIVIRSKERTVVL